VAQGLAGWYPDPAGAPGRYRHWDGTQWSAETTDDPRRPPPVPPVEPARRRSPAFWIVAAVAVLALLTVIAVTVSSAVRSIGPITAPPNPQPTVGGDDSSPTPSPTRTPTPTPSRSAKPSPSPASNVPLVPCPEANPNWRQPHPYNNRVYGGNLSFPAEPTFQPAAVEWRLTFALDVAQQVLPVNASPDWIAQLAVGQLRGSDGFVHDPKNTAESFVQCTLTSDMYTLWQPTRTDRRNEAVTIDGHPGWLIESDVTVSTTPGLPFAGDRAIFLVVRDGKDWGIFFGAVPIGDADLEAVLDRTVAALQAS
jgi:hypothetical protein